MSKAKRTALGPKKRFAIFHRDGFTCQYCGKKPPEVVLEVDHIIAVVDGGTNQPENLVSSCWDCNRGKGATSLQAVPPSTAEVIARTAELRKQVKALNALQASIREEEIEVSRRLGGYWCNLLCEPKDLGKYNVQEDCMRSLRTFLKKLTETQIRNAMEIAVGRLRPNLAGHQKAWTYFCGVCWKCIKGEGTL